MQKYNMKKKKNSLKNQTETIMQNYNLKLSFKTLQLL